MASGDTRTQQYLGIAANGNRADLPGETCCETRTQTLTREVAERVIGLDEEVQELKNNPDVVDIVETYQDLEDYDTSTLTNKDIIRVLQDSTHSGNSTYYRWNSATEEFDFVGEISGGSVNVVQTGGTSTTDVMSQNAMTSMIFADPNTRTQVRIGGINVSGPNSVALAGSAGGNRAVSVGANAGALAQYSVAIGPNVSVSYEWSVGLGANAKATRNGEVNVGTGDVTRGYNSTSYRVLGGVHDGQLANDAVTVGQLNATIDAINTALSTNIPHVGA